MNYTFTIRLTKHCQADCSYCCSWQEAPGNFMDPEELRASIKYVVEELWPRMRIQPSSATVQYIGGDILAMPFREFKESVMTVRKELRDLGVPFIDGVQSNLIASSRRVDELMHLFSGRVGTSWDGLTDRRSVGGSADAYREMSSRAIRQLAASPVAGAVVYVDRETFTDVLSEYHFLKSEGLGMVVRPAFVGGRDASTLSAFEYESAMISLLDAWFMSGVKPIDPLVEMTESRLLAKSITSQPCPGCNRQSDCAKKGINIEPNGDLFLCFETADAGVGKFGNAVAREFDNETWARLALRERVIQQECADCPYYSACKGGCLVESDQAGRGWYGKTPMCEAYKSIFASIDKRISEHGALEVKTWLQSFNSTKIAA